MKKIFLLVLLVSAVLFGNAQTRIIWTCPMHPQIKKEKPGKCPICGMTLVKKTEKVSPPKAPTKAQPEMKMPKDTVPDKNKMEEMDMKKDTANKMDMHEQEN